MSHGMPNPKKLKKIWVLFDVSNGSYPAKNYVWWYPTKQEALARLKEHQAFPEVRAKLIGPYPFVSEKS